MIRKVEIERFTLISSKQFDDEVAALNAGISIAMAADVAETTQIERPPRGREEVSVQHIRSRS